ncbi:MAG: hypothetical protein ABIS47_14050, partial [Acidimicrobiales bacterium]
LDQPSTDPQVTTAPAPEPEGKAQPPQATITRQPQLDAPMCFQCGTTMQRAGSCYVCAGCGTTSGCS